MRFAVVFLALFSLATTSSASWNGAKNAADDIVYKGITATFYCGCTYKSDGDSDGSGKITDTKTCGYVGPAKHSHRAGRVEWEHIVPASLMPARQFECWTNPPDGQSGRSHCEKTDPRAQAMIFDLHNLAPSIGQVNALRNNDRYGDLPDSASDFGECAIEDAKGLFEPHDCIKGDVARVWFYMRMQHGVQIPSAEDAMFQAWALADPVSPWERERQDRIEAETSIGNPFVKAAIPNSAGSCPWE